MVVAIVFVYLKKQGHLFKRTIAAGMSIIRFNKTTNTIRQVLTLFCVVIIRTCGFCIFCAEENGFIILLAKISKEILSNEEVRP